MSVLEKLRRYAVDEYLELEKHSEVRHEYADGYIYAMVGASAAHNQLTTNLGYAIHGHLRGSTCRVFQSDMKVQIDRVFYYSDLVVTCEPVEPKAYFLTAPKLIVEVLSGSTESKDRLEKLVTYQRLPSLEEYVLASQDQKGLEILRRAGDEWQKEVYGPGDLVHFASLNLDLPIAEIYEGLDMV